MAPATRFRAGRSPWGNRPAGSWGRPASPAHADELPVGGGIGRGRPPRLAHVGQQREDLDAVDEPATGFEPTLDTEGHDAAKAAREVPLRQLVARVRLGGA